MNAVEAPDLEETLDRAFPSLPSTGAAPNGSWKPVRVSSTNGSGWVLCNPSITRPAPCGVPLLSPMARYYPPLRRRSGAVVVQPRGTTNNRAVNKRVLSTGESREWVGENLGTGLNLWGLNAPCRKTIFPTRENAHLG